MILIVNGNRKSDSKKCLASSIGSSEEFIIGNGISSKDSFIGSHGFSSVIVLVVVGRLSNR
jgi:hypothetical protein